MGHIAFITSSETTKNLYKSSLNCSWFKEFIAETIDVMLVIMVRVLISAKVIIILMVILKVKVIVVIKVVVIVIIAVKKRGMTISMASAIAL